MADPAITGLVLAGGLARRMGGLDKSLQPLRGRPLLAWVVERLQPQVHTVVLNSHRLPAGAGGLDLPVWPDSLPDHPGPLAGLLTGLQRMDTDWLLTVPCDVPLLPADLASRLMQAARQAGADVAIATAPDAQGWRRHPVFCLAHRRVLASLAEALERGERQVDRWALRQQAAQARFPDAGAFRNLNTLQDLATLEASPDLSTGTPS
ncbi:molybdenum cofactor guanylyltransferase [Sphaerotilus hippei]|uniref:Molybdenum cofactor guanylyltransferase n=1 Tax=Sphaerotilus hippei TaxID=744406 RepID=A0A318H3Y1_9BURK|nr:molybdenum cofactor guanylyltransferase MobA [Sphaerotilus hippei]PXW98170.1 molybdenum cofactor guanylyltransferase [Sphaerotilus hippei]